MILDLNEFEFEEPQFYSKPVERLYSLIRNHLDENSIDRQEYVLGADSSYGMGELVLRPIKQFWVIYTTERGANFDVSVFTSEFHAVNYFLFRLTGKAESIDWSNI